MHFILEHSIILDVGKYYYGKGTLFTIIEFTRFQIVPMQSLLYLIPTLVTVIYIHEQT